MATDNNNPSGKDTASGLPDRDDIQSRLFRLTSGYPSLAPFLGDLIEYLNQKDILIDSEVEDIATVLRVYQKNPDLVALLISIVDVMRSESLRSLEGSDSQSE